ncbi:MAG: NAD-dependent dihydropyrimidine dehydrogenase subunit PreA, partial [Burkholderiaceae bacterium]
GCNLCVSICPVPDTITMRVVPPGELDQRSGHPVSADYANWTTHPNNPASAAA